MIVMQLIIHIIQWNYDNEDLRDDRLCLQSQPRPKEKRFGQVTKDGWH